MKKKNILPIFLSGTAIATILTAGLAPTGSAIAHTKTQNQTICTQLKITHASEPWCRKVPVRVWHTHKQCDVITLPSGRSRQGGNCRIVNFHK